MWIIPASIHKYIHAPQDKMLESILNKIFQEQIDDGDLNILKDRRLRVSLKGLPLSLIISFDGCRLHRVHANSGDVNISASALDLYRLMTRATDPDTLFFQRRLSIEGDTDLGLAIKNLLDSVELEQLPKAMVTLINITLKKQEFITRIIRWN